MLNIKIKDKRDEKEVYDDTTYLGEEVLCTAPREGGGNPADEPKEPKSF